MMVRLVSCGVKECRQAVIYRGSQRHPEREKKGRTTKSITEYVRSQSSSRASTKRSARRKKRMRVCASTSRIAMVPVLLQVT
jgi:hypothetical protein